MLAISHHRSQLSKIRYNTYMKSKKTSHHNETVSKDFEVKIHEDSDIDHEENLSWHERIRKKPIHKQLIFELWRTGKKPLLVLIGAGILLLLLTPLFTYLYFIRDLSSKESIMTRNAGGVILLDRTNKPFFTFYEAQTKETVSIDEVSQDIQDAVVSVEDKDFYKHPGFSIEGIGRAIVTDLQQEELTQGGSTITQQLVKNTLLSQEKSFLRKYQEIVLALEIERRFGKKDILEMYLNTAYFGEGAFGINAAAKQYFNKTPAQLTLGESALLAGILPAPSAYSPISGDRDRAFQRQKIVLNQLVQQGYITSEERDKAEQQEIIFNQPKNTLNIQAPHFALMVKDELIKKYGEQRLARSGFVVKTTLDLNGQKYAEEIVENQVQRLSANDVTNGAAVVMDPNTGEILALVGSHDWSDETNGRINMATSPRQPGSSFKPIIYAKALQERLITPATQLEDQAIEFPGGYKPKNYDGKFRGKVLARYALANSLNIPALHVMEKVGISDGIAFAEKLGVSTLKNPSQYGLSMVLGAVEIPLLEMTSAFGAFANEGTYSHPTTILEIKDKKGNVIFQSKPDQHEALTDDTAFQISSILSDSKARSEVFGSSLTISRPAAVKTGTTENYRDALTIGYTPQIVVGAWVGNNDNTPMDRIAGSLGAAPIWRQLMEYFLKGKSVQQFRQPSGILKVSVCLENGLRAESATSSAYPEYFLPGTMPKATCAHPTPTEEPTPTPESEPTSTPVPTDTPAPTPTAEPTATPTESLPIPTL